MADYRLVYGEVEPGLVDRDNSYTCLTEAVPQGVGFHCPLRLERYAPQDDDWDVVDYDAADGMDVGDIVPWREAERRILSRNHVTDVNVPVVAT